ncbi:hypothetical protein [uncultured Desulfosarcina sp.]|uniref:hypothetical protein n=1 Tax=uncultured Desulfosarcina sp. TaxID=218289 RepID=UPI0029C65C2D|nr:hypothetical protein [uncultured Desulfosarcina sp.]
MIEKRISTIPTRLQTVACIFLLLAAVSVAPAADKGEKPSKKVPLLVIVNQGARIGPVLEGEPVRHTVRLANHGTAPLEIVRMRIWKGSRVIHADRKIVPGAEGGVELELKTLGAGPRPLRGVTLLTNENKPNVHRIAVDLRVTPQIQTTPDRVDVSGVVGCQMRGEIRIHGNLELPLQLSTPESDLPPDIAYDYKPAGAPGEYCLTVQSRRETAGVVRGRIRFRTNYPKKPFLTVPVMARSLPAVQVVPKRIDFGTVTKREPATRSEAPNSRQEGDNPKANVFVRLNQEGSLTIEKAEVTDLPDGFEIRVNSIESGRLYRADITARIDRLSAKEYSAVLKIRTDHPLHPELRVPVILTVKESFRKEN